MRKIRGGTLFQVDCNGNPPICKVLNNTVTNSDNLKQANQKRPSNNNLKQKVVNDVNIKQANQKRPSNNNLNQKADQKQKITPLFNNFVQIDEIDDNGNRLVYYAQRPKYENPEWNPPEDALKGPNGWRAHVVIAEGAGMYGVYYYNKYDKSPAQWTFPTSEQLNQPIKGGKFALKRKRTRGTRRGHRGRGRVMGTRRR